MPAKKVKITVSGLYNYSTTLSEAAALKFLKDLKKKHMNAPAYVPALRVSIQTV